jgi:hypothetical protein
MSSNQTLTCYCDPSHYLPTPSECTLKSTTEACYGFAIATVIMFAALLALVVWEMIVQTFLRGQQMKAKIFKYGYKMKVAAYVALIVAASSMYLTALQPNE